MMVERVEVGRTSVEEASWNHDLILSIRLVETGNFSLLVMKCKLRWQRDMERWDARSKLRSGRSLIQFFRMRSPVRRYFYL